ncbi:hypothetical protein BO94DRAFT_207780 [Aspergillus sclerotioniger CBS 115572]|uniref:Uncharacterized protein n=1 Tax=Aspergillus sclerotioniger CBS 115572 TaxID=1450535 RepID=A0A317VNU0_9EURO|nr:hypothetical protein BO94DRAFT_207780 [Aspergillus sclerotioniger CBS 115572]PWY76034.1 hypothetical protein BO94DRAFT_207780 [Aspergillus sclerotioniger CBS 115572]
MANEQAPTARWTLLARGLFVDGASQCCCCVLLMGSTIQARLWHAIQPARPLRKPAPLRRQPLVQSRPFKRAPCGLVWFLGLLGRMAAFRFLLLLVVPDATMGGVCVGGSGRLHSTSNRKIEKKKENSNACDFATDSSRRPVQSRQRDKNSSIALEPAELSID